MKDHRTELIEIQQETQAQSAASQSQGPGNQEQAESLGLDKGGALKGLEAVAEHDPALANELSGVAYLADTVLDEQGPLLKGLAAEADVLGCHDLLGWMDDDIAELESLGADGDQASVDVLIDRLRQYAGNLADGLTVVESEGDVQQQLRAYEVQRGITAVGAVGLAMQSVEAPVRRMDALEEALKKQQESLIDILGRMEDSMTKEAADEIAGLAATILKEISGGASFLAKLCGAVIDGAASVASDALAAAFRGDGEGLDAVEELAGAGEKVHESGKKALVEAAGYGIVVEAMDLFSDAYSDWQTMEEWNAMSEELREVVEATWDTCRDLLDDSVEPIRATFTDDLAPKLKDLDTYLVDGGRHVVETCEAHWEKADSIRSENPSRYDQL